jgi:hypothetical protein
LAFALRHLVLSRQQRAFCVEHSLQIDPRQRCKPLKFPLVAGYVGI